MNPLLVFSRPIWSQRLLWASFGGLGLSLASGGNWIQNSAFAQSPAPAYGLQKYRTPVPALQLQVEFQGRTQISQSTWGLRAFERLLEARRPQLLKDLSSLKSKEIYIQLADPGAPAHSTHLYDELSYCLDLHCQVDQVEKGLFSWQAAHPGRYRDSLATRFFKQASFADTLTTGDFTYRSTTREDFPPMKRMVDSIRADLRSYDSATQRDGEGSLVRWFALMNGAENGLILEARDRMGNRVSSRALSDVLIGAWALMRTHLFMNNNTLAVERGQLPVGGFWFDLPSSRKGQSLQFGVIPYYAKSISRQRQEAWQKRRNAAHAATSASSEGLVTYVDPKTGVVTGEGPPLLAPPPAFDEKFEPSRYGAFSGANLSGVRMRFSLRFVKDF